MDELAEELEKLRAMCLDFCKLYITVRTVCNHLSKHTDDLKKVLEILKEDKGDV